MTTFEQARSTVAAALSSEYPAEAGLEISLSGLENSTTYQLFASAAERGYTTPDDTAHTVDKETGEYRPVYGTRYVIPDAQPCGEPDDEE